MKIHCLSLKEKYDTLFKIRSRKPAFLLNPLKAMLNLVIDRICLQQLEYEMERADIPDDSIFLNSILWSPCLPLSTYSTRESQ